MQTSFFVSAAFRFFLRMFFVVLSIGGVGLFSLVQADEGQELLQNLEYEPGQLVLKLKEGAPEDFGLGKTGSEELDQIFEKYGVVNIKESPYGEYMEAAKERNELSEMLKAEHFQSSRVHEQNRYIVIFPEETDIEELAQEVSQYELVEYAQPNYGGIAEFIQNNEWPKYSPGQLFIKLNYEPQSPFAPHNTGNASLDTLMEIFEVQYAEQLIDPTYPHSLPDSELSPRALERRNSFRENQKKSGAYRVYVLGLPPSMDMRMVGKIFSAHPALEYGEHSALGRLIQDTSIATSFSESTEDNKFLYPPVIIFLLFLGSAIFFSIFQRMKKS